LIFVFKTNKFYCQAGANVVFTTKGIDDLCLKYFVEAGAMGVRRCLKVISTKKTNVLITYSNINIVLLTVG